MLRISRFIVVAISVMVLFVTNNVSAFSKESRLIHSKGLRKIRVSNFTPLKTKLQRTQTTTALTSHAFCSTLAPQILKSQAITAFCVNLPLAALLLYSNQKSLTTSGLFHATLLGTGLWSYLGWKGWLIGALYFVFGSFVTKVKMAEKERLGIAEKRHGARGPENVWGSAATAMVCAVMAALPIFSANSHMWEIAFVTAFATKLADTFSSEIGKAFGKRTFLITSLKPVPKGTEGAISLEGTVSGVIGSILLAAAAYALGFLSSPIDFGIVIGASFFATTIESYMGAVLQRSGGTANELLNNEMVNLIMTIIGAVTSIRLYKYFLP